MLSLVRVRLRELSERSRPEDCIVFDCFVDDQGYPGGNEETFGYELSLEQPELTIYIESLTFRPPRFLVSFEECINANGECWLSEMICPLSDDFCAREGSHSFWYVDDDYEVRVQSVEQIETPMPRQVSEAIHLSALASRRLP